MNTSSTSGNEPKSLSGDGGGKKKRPASSLSPSSPSSPGEHETTDSKRPAVTNASVGGVSEGASSSSSPLVDVCDSVGLKPGDRVEVMWDIHFDEEHAEEGAKAEQRVDAARPKDAATDATPKSNQQPEAKAGGSETAGATVQGNSRTTMRWWGATLLLHDGRSHVLSDEDGGHNGASVSAALRVLDYDPYPEGGFPDRSLEEVVLLSDRSILNVSTGTRAHWRREGDKWEPGPKEVIDEDGLNPAVDHDEGEGETIPLPNPAENLRTIVDNILQSTLMKSSNAARMNAMTAAQRAALADKVSRGKEVLLQKMIALTESDPGGVITGEHVQRCMAEMVQEM